MNVAIQKELDRLLRKEEKYLKKTNKKSTQKQGITQKIENKIPEKLRQQLEVAFYKAFSLVFEKGSTLVEKTFSKEDLELEFQVNDFRIEKRATKKTLKKVDALSKKDHLKNMCMTTVEGIGLGVIGVGLPDIPIFLGMLMKGLYETATSYGYAYDTENERVFLMRLIVAALATEEEKQKADANVEAWIKAETASYVFEEEKKAAAHAMATMMLTAKFIQGLPIVGVAGGAVNPIIYRKVMQYAAMKYKKRYLLQKQNT